MTDKELVERLNAYSAQYQNHGGITAEAADRIEQLCAELYFEKIDNTKLKGELATVARRARPIQGGTREPAAADLGGITSDGRGGSLYTRIRRIFWWNGHSFRITRKGRGCRRS